MTPSTAGPGLSLEEVIQEPFSTAEVSEKACVSGGVCRRIQRLITLATACRERNVERDRSAPPVERSPAPGSRRIGSVDLLRCLAGSAVLWAHIGGGSRFPAIAEPAELGRLGVEVFFVVSGFVIPHAMYRSGFVFPTDSGNYLLRRLVRLDPPYFLASAGAALLWYLSSLAPGFQGEPPDITLVKSLAHVGYLNGILGLGWYDPVCWTLGIEFQFYLLAALLYPLFALPIGRYLAFEAAVLLACVALARTYGTPVHSPWLLTWSPLFLAGIAAYRLRNGFDSRRGFALHVALCTGVACLTTGWQSAAAGSFAVLVIGFATFTLPPLLASYAAITYSLYLVHVPIGGRIQRFLARYGDSGLVDFAAIAAAIVGSLVAAIVFWYLVEAPSLALASRIRRGGARPGPATATSAGDPGAGDAR